jgi:molybdate transport system regulatory protein
MPARRKPTAGPASPAAHGRRWDHLELLERIDREGSISAAAAAMGMGYKAAWQAVESLNNRAGQPLVERQAGGPHGGGTALTPYGRRVVATLRRLDDERRHVLERLAAAHGDWKDGDGHDFDYFYRLLRRFDMQTSARNQFLGHVTSVARGAVNAEVTLDLGGGQELVAIITNESVEHLGLVPGSEAFALVKASWVILAPDDGLRTSARNHLRGTVARLVRGAVNSEVILELPGGRTVVAIVTNGSVDALGLVEGARACALIKASHVILATAA